MAHGVLLELRRWARSAGVLHATVDCLKLALKLTASGGCGQADMGCLKEGQCQGYHVAVVRMEA